MTPKQIHIDHMSLMMTYKHFAPRCCAPVIHQIKTTNNKNNKITFSIKMKDVGISKPKKNANKVMGLT